MNSTQAFSLITLAAAASCFAPGFALGQIRDHQIKDQMSIEAIARQSKALERKTKEEADRIMTRLTHAKELLGKYYRRSVVKSGEQIPDVELTVSDWVKRGLAKKWQSQTKAVSKAILRESRKYGFDPVFLMAVIENESSFNPEAIGPVGEIGLMQVTPQTGKWIAERSNLKWKGEATLKDPVANIRIGAAYLAYLRERFGFHSRLYLAAYNMGATNVNRALDKQIWPKDYASRVMQRYIRFYSELKDDLKKSVTN